MPSEGVDEAGANRDLKPGPGRVVPAEMNRQRRYYGQDRPNDFSCDTQASFSV